MSSKPTLAITVGDPAGIGPEVTAKALSDPAVRGLARFVVFGDRRFWTTTNGTSLAQFDFDAVPVGEFDKPASDITLVEFPDIDYDAIPIGTVTPAGGEASIRYILAAIDGIKAGRLDGVATGPINKVAIHQAGYPWPGHTELFAEKFGAESVAMMFAGGPFRVVLATIHMSLREMLATISAEGILSTIRLADDALRRFFGIAEPRIAVCGINCHAGEGGRFGDEDASIVAPAIAQARAEGINAMGPLPADTVFRGAIKGRSDIVVAMYHDQGLIPIKTVAFEESVNITLGIPAIRTSVDHGTAFDIAGQNVAEPDSMKSAIGMAVAMIHASQETE
jgi:4-hydroxythreonine-4-phosphate dehydrogenase